MKKQGPLQHTPVAPGGAKPFQPGEKDYEEKPKPPSRPPRK